MDNTFDVIVIGLGGHGSATLLSLSRTVGAKVLGLEQFPEAGHDKGSSHGRSRIYRQAYFEDPSYVPLLQRSLELWKELNEHHKQLYNGEGLLELCGGLMIGDPDSPVVRDEVNQRFPAFNLNSNEVGVYEKNAGYLHPERCIQTSVRLARENGAVAHFGEKMKSWSLSEPDRESDSDDFVHVETDKATYKCRRLILCMGAWAVQQLSNYAELMKSSNISLHLERRVLYWLKLQPDDLPIFNSNRMPVYIWDLSNGSVGQEKEESSNFYGFPEQVGYEGTVKVAVHQSTAVQRYQRPEEIDRSVKPGELDYLRKLLRSRMPTLSEGEFSHAVTCMYTMTSDEHFLIDFLPNHRRQVIIASPCSGHGFKFCSVIGEILRDLSLHGETPHDISLFSLSRRQNKSSPQHKLSKL